MVSVLLPLAVEPSLCTLLSFPRGAIFGFDALDYPPVVLQLPLAQGTFVPSAYPYSFKSALPSCSPMVSSHTQPGSEWPGKGV